MISPLLILFKKVKRRCKFLKNTAFHISRWVKLYSTVTTEDGDILTAKQVKALQKRLLQLDEENLILKKAIAFLHAELSQRLNAVHLLRFQH